MSGNIHSGLPWTTGSAPIVGDGFVQFGGPSGKKVFFDELSQADQALVLQYLLSAQFPILMPPQGVVDNNGGQGNTNTVSGVATSSSITAISMQIDQAKNEIISQMLDAWLASNKKIAEESKRADEKKRIEDMSIAYHEIRHQENLRTDNVFPIFAVGMIIAGAGIYQSILPDQTVGMVQMNPIVNMYNQVVPPVMGDMRAELGLIGAFFATGIQYFTVAQMASETAGGKNPPKDGAFAKGYAENIINLLGSGSFNNYLLAIVTRSIPGSEPLNSERVKDLMAFVKIVLLSSALAMLYQVEAGKMTGLEFAGMLNGNIKFAVGDIRATLVAQIKQHLEQMDPKTREIVLSSLLEYFDSNPDIEALSEPSKVFAGIYSTLPRGELAG